MLLLPYTAVRLLLLLLLLLYTTADMREISCPHFSDWAFFKVGINDWREILGQHESTSGTVTTIFGKKKRKIGRG